MFESLTVVLIWILVASVAWYIFFESKIVPVAYFTGLGIVTAAALLILAFMSPNGRTAEIVISLLSLVITPLGLALLFLGRVLTKDELVKIATSGFLSAAFGLLLLGSTPAIAHLLAENLERQAVSTAPRPPQRPPSAIVLLGQGTTRVTGLGEPQIEISESGDRIIYAAQLYREGVANQIIVSAGTRPEINAAWMRDPFCDNPQIAQSSDRCVAAYEADDIRRLLEQLGVPGNAIVIPRAELANQREWVDIRTSALDVWDQLNRPTLDDQITIALVTSAIPMKRARLTFEQLGLVVDPKPTDYYTLAMKAPGAGRQGWRYIRIPELIPSADALVLTTKVTTEYFTTLFYFIRGWLSPFKD